VSLDIVAVLGRYLDLHVGLGGHFTACCPFHGERTASLIVMPDGERWECLGCGGGGDAIAFVARYEHCSREEAQRRMDAWTWDG
jgi:DNA primase